MIKEVEEKVLMALDEMKNEENEISNISKNQIKNIAQTKPQMASLKPEKIINNIEQENISSFEDFLPPLIYFMTSSS